MEPIVIFKAFFFPSSFSLCCLELKNSSLAFFNSIETHTLVRNPEKIFAYLKSVPKTEM